MPLFGHKNHDDNLGPHAYDNPNAGAPQHNTLHRNNPDYAYEQGGHGVGGGAGPGAGVGGGPGRFDDDGFDHNNTHRAGGPGGPGAGVGAGGRYDEPAGGMGAGPGHHANVGPGGAAHNNMGARTDAYGNPEHPGHQSGGGKHSGKVESALGTVLGSSSLKQKGLEKQQESHALRAQAAELDIAEQHEQEALRRRERAVAHGAHPDHGHLGSHNPNRQGGEFNQGAGGNNLDGPGRHGPTGGGAY